MRERSGTHRVRRFLFGGTFRPGDELRTRLVRAGLHRELAKRAHR